MTLALDTPVRTQAQNLDRVLSAGLPALLAFEKPNCNPCRVVEPTLKIVAQRYAGQILVVRVDDVTQGGLAERFDVKRVPTLVFWKDQREIGRVEGAVPVEALRAHLDYWSGSGTPPQPASGPAISLNGDPQPVEGKKSSAPRGTPEPPNDAPIQVTDASFDELVLRSPLPVLVDFWAPWCGPCRIVAPTVEELGRQYAGRLRVAKVNTDDNPYRAGSLGIQGIPTLILFKNGREVDRIVGAVSKQVLQSRVERAL